MVEVAHDDVKDYIRNGECTFKSINVVNNDFDMTDLARKYIKERNDTVSEPYTKYCCSFVNFFLLLKRINISNI